MTWWNAALHWVVCATQFCFPIIRHKANSGSADAIKLNVEKAHQGVLISRDDLVRQSDTRVRCSVLFTVTQFNHNQQLSLLLQHILEKPHYPYSPSLKKLK